MRIDFRTLCSMIELSSVKWRGSSSPETYWPTPKMTVSDRPNSCLAMERTDFRLMTMRWDDIPSPKKGQENISRILRYFSVQTVNRAGVAWIFSNYLAVFLLSLYICRLKFRFCS